MINRRFMKVTAAVIALILTVGIVLPHSAPARAMYENTYVNTGNIRDDLVGVAKTQVGYLESGFNNNKFGSAYGLNNQAWCALFVWWCCLKAEVPGLPMTASCSGLRDGFIASGAVWHSVDSGYAPRKGDIVLYYTTLTTGLGHSGIVREDSPAEGPIYTIEGNTSDPSGQALDGVFAKTRPLVGDVVSVAGYLSLTEVPASGSVPVVEEEPEEEAEEAAVEEESEIPTEEEIPVTEEAETEQEDNVPEEEPEEPVEPDEVKHGWRLEDGRWHYYDVDGELLTYDWAPVSYGWRWLDENGELDETVWADADYNIYYV